MNHQEFNKLVKARLTDCENVLAAKDKEYSSDEDRLHNFKYSGLILEEDPIRSLRGMWIKHFVSILDMFKRLIEDPFYMPSEKIIKDKLGDNINYTLLFEGLIEDRKKEVITGSGLNSEKIGLNGLVENEEYWIINKSNWQARIGIYKGNLKFFILGDCYFLQITESEINDFVFFKS